MEFFEPMAPSSSDGGGALAWVGRADDVRNKTTDCWYEKWFARGGILLGSSSRRIPARTSGVGG